MPLYDYRCTECGREVEVMHGINDSGPATCQHCGGAMRKALSPPAIHFKGSGWAKKDAAAGARKAKPAGAKDHAKASAKESASNGSDSSSSVGDSGKATSRQAAKAESTLTSTAGSGTD
jgi:putative FmdB family regulatory protein